MNKPWFASEPAALFLAVAQGEIYSTEIVRAERLVQQWVEWAECGDFDDADPQCVERITAMIADEDYWQNDNNGRPAAFSEKVYDNRISFFRMEGMACVGAISSRPDVDDGSPECPLMHILHPTAAGCTPTLLFGRLPAHQRKLALP